MNDRPVSQPLEQVLLDIGPCAIAVSGGVDSMSLALFAHRTGCEVTVIHAVSPAVPRAATLRVRHYAEQERWRLREIDAGEFEDSDYLSNPANRCFHCKKNLYGTIAAAGYFPILSGTNTDDLQDWRPGLVAAERWHVRHPFVEAGMSKSDVRALAGALGAEDLAELPAAPCLSSRVETALPVSAKTLGFVEAAELELQSRFPGQTVRCRVRSRGIVIELEPDALEALGRDEYHSLVESITLMARRREVAGLVGIEPYRQGGAFLRETGAS